MLKNQKGSGKELQEEFKVWKTGCTVKDERGGMYLFQQREG